MWQSTDVIVFNAGLADSIRLLFWRTSGSAVNTCSSTVQSHSYKTCKFKKNNSTDVCTLIKEMTKINTPSDIFLQNTCMHMYDITEMKTREKRGEERWEDKSREEMSIEQTEQKGREEKGRERKRWDEMKWNGIRWDGMECDGIRWGEMRWVGMGWEEMELDGMTWKVTSWV